MDGRSLAGYQQKKLWLNAGDGKFVEVAQAVGANDTYDGRSIALADLQNRGALEFQPWGALAPILAIALMTMGTGLIGDGIARTAAGIDRERGDE